MKLLLQYYSNPNASQILSKIIIVLLLLIEISTSRKVTRLRCFECSTNNEADRFDCLHGTGLVFEEPNSTRTYSFSDKDKVIDDPSNNSSIKLVNCPHYCTIRRQEYADLSAGINFLNRSCEDTKLDEVIVNGYFITYLRSCKSDLCNSGDGIESLSDIPEDELVPSAESERSNANSIYNNYSYYCFIQIQPVFTYCNLSFLFSFPFYMLLFG